MNFLSALRRFSRAATDYGWRRAVTKAAGRLGISLLPNRGPAGGAKTFSVIGCGQAAFATLCYFIATEKGAVFLDCYDPDAAAAQNLRTRYGFEKVAENATEIFENGALRQLVIASNHASHTGYAIAGLARNLAVFCEKPLCTTQEQLTALSAAVAHSEGCLWAGFNRPFAPAVQFIAARIKDCRQALTLHCTVHGHLLPANHWYREEAEGTRISGNMGHWIDLAVHLMATRGVMPGTFTLSLHAATDTLPKDDNVVLIITTDFGDLISISLNARHEPFGGIRENIEVQCGTFAAHINDFKVLHWWQGSRQGTKKYRFKDPGHGALVKAFLDGGAPPRPWTETELSTALTLYVSDLARHKTRNTCTVNAATLALRP